MRAALLSHRFRLLGVVVAVAFLAALPLLRLGHGRTATPGHDAPRVTAPKRPDRFVWRTPATTTRPNTPVQLKTDAVFVDVIGRQPGMTSAAALSVPAPAVAGGWPALAVQRAPDEWARDFAFALLDVDYGKQSRGALGPWLQAHEAPSLMPGIPESVADKMLYTSLLATEVFGGQPTPVPSAPEWDANAQAGVRQTVSDLVVQVNPRWAALIASGWQPPEPRMTTLDVSGLLTTDRGDAVSTERFALQLVVGTARWREGYGTVSVSGWQRGPA